MSGVYEGPFMLDDAMDPDPVATETSASGYMLFFDLTPGVVTMGPAQGSDTNVAMSDAPIAGTTVTLAQAVVGGEDPVLPENVSFANDVAPIFTRRGCQSCHDGGGIGKDQGDLHLNGAVEKMYREIVEEISPTHGVTRVDLAEPAASLLLTMPSREDPPDQHPNITFANALDPDYLTILVWIQEGALDN